jgi:pyruvate-formate lyase-activating enzyme
MDIVSQVNTCTICARGCEVLEGKTGACGKYRRENGELKEVAPNRYLLVCPVSIETMPLLHFYPKGKFLQITTTGCNFNCPGCVSNMLVQTIPADSSALLERSADEIVRQALSENCIGITFMMNDPLASFFTFKEVARKAKAQGLLVGCSSNGYFTDESAAELAPFLDFMNIGIKGFADADYRCCGARSIQPVLAAIALFYKARVHLEVSMTCKKGDEGSLEAFVTHLNECNYAIPVQLMRYMPLEDAPLSLQPSVAESEAFCQKLQGICEHVYLFNTPGTALLHTRCSGCGALLIERDFYGPMGAKIRKIHLAADGKCPECGLVAPIRGVKERSEHTEKNFQGGYPFTRALEMVQAALFASGVCDFSAVTRVWEKMLTYDRLDSLHVDLQSLDAYLASVGRFAAAAGVANHADRLTDYMRGKIEQIQQRLAGVSERPTVYYSMAKPLFALKGSRFENQLVTAAGGISLNKQVKGEGRPGLLIDVQTLTELDPDVIFISSFFSNSTDDFQRECLALGLDIAAVRAKRIYAHPYPNWDFGSPRWILGLMYIANVLHPHLFRFNLFAEAQAFYRIFYAEEFVPEQLNLSFARPAANWAGDCGHRSYPEFPGGQPALEREAMS